MKRYNEHTGFAPQFDESRALGSWVSTGLVSRNTPWLGEPGILQQDATSTTLHVTKRNASRYDR